VTAATLAAPTVEALARAHPEFSTWLDLLVTVDDEAASPRWTRAMPESLADGARPLLAGTTLIVDPGDAAAWWRRLIDVAARSVPALASLHALDAPVVLEAAVALDFTRLAALPETAAVSPEPLRALAPLAAYPWLQRCAARLADRVPADHTRAWCPICGAWAALAEARGLEGARRLRCARCGADWAGQWLQCPFCGTDEHARLRGLVSETIGASRRADGCAACGAWVKTVATLRPCTVSEVRLLDLATVELDVAALERGWKRPAGLGAPLDVRVVPWRRRWWR
jgi:FdhE protein